MNDNSLLDDLNNMVSALPPDLTLSAPSAANLELLANLPELGASPGGGEKDNPAAEVDAHPSDEAADAAANPGEAQDAAVTQEEPAIPSSDPEYRVLTDGSDVKK